MPTKEVRQVDRVIIRFAGDSGDGMQLTGDRFTSETAEFGNDLSTLPNFPAEIRAPAGTLPGVSSFQVHFADHDIMTPGDAPNVLVAMNPAALKANVKDLPRGAQIIVNSDEFTPRACQRVGYTSNPLDDGSLADYRVTAIPLTSMTVEALKDFDISKKDASGRRTCSRSGCCRGCTTGRPNPPWRSWRRSSPRTRKSPRRISPRFKPDTTSRDNRTVRRLVRSQTGGFCSLARTATFPGIWPSPTGSSQRPRPPGCRSSSARTPSHRRPTSCTNSPSTRTSVCAPSKPRTKSPE